MNEVKNEMRQLNTQEAIMFCKNEVWKKLNDVERAWFQLYQERLAMPFSEFHKCMELLLGRPVWTHEFVDPEALKIEAIRKQKATFQQILDKIPRGENHT